MLIRLELAGPGVQYIADNQLYNSIITAHAILMSAPLRSVYGLAPQVPTKGNSRVDADGPVGPNPTGKPKRLSHSVKEVSVESPLSMESISESYCRTSRLTNLIRIFRHNRTFAESGPRTNVLFPSILSLVSTLFQANNRKPRREVVPQGQYARDRLQIAQAGNCGITYGSPRAPKNSILRCGGLRPKIVSGDGAAIVLAIGRAAVFNLHVRMLASKADRCKTVSRGSDRETLHNQPYNQISMKNISNLKNLVTAYELIKSNPGNMTPGADKSATLDGISKGYLGKVQKELKAGTYKFNPARRIQIPKPGKKETRPLTIASPREKVVQKAIQLVLEPVYEQEFLESSHGFRPDKGTRSAIRYLESKFQSVQYIIEADFSKAFDSINHKKLLGLLKNKIRCEKTLALIKSALKAGYFELGQLHDNINVGTPQGSILSPILCNIYLHELDKFMEKIKGEYDAGTRRKNTPEYMKRQNKAKY